MQPINWYFQRIKGMTPSEIAWRIGSGICARLDRYRFALNQYPSLNYVTGFYESDELKPGFRTSGEWEEGKDVLGTTNYERKWLRKLVKKANLLVQHKFTFFDLKEHDLGRPINWNRDHSAGKNAPLGFAPAIDYRDYQVTGDCKLVWEPNRHHQLVVLARAYKTSGDLKFAAAIVEQMESWFVQCPFGKGMNWRSPLELAIRLINWVWAIDLILESGLFSGEFRSKTLYSVYLHLWEITRKYSRGSSANNHLVGEAAGVFIAASYFNKFPETEKWRKESRDILLNEIITQTYADGCTREQALGYQLFVSQFFLFSGIVARRSNHDFPLSYWSRLEKMMETVGFFAEGGSNLPMFGDCDDGYALDLGSLSGDVGGILSTGAVMFGRPDFKHWAGECREQTWWLLGPSSQDKFDGISETSQDDQIKSHDFSEAGYYLIQSGKKDAGERISVFFDCGELGYKSIAAHGHADALSFTLRAFGVDIFVDPGTYDYFSFPEWRNYFRSTRAHNTIVVDNFNQSEIIGPFMWSHKAIAHCLEWEKRENGGRVSGEHNGYKRLADPVTHRRTLDLDGNSRKLIIRDDIFAREMHEVSIYFHLSELCALEEVTLNNYEITAEKKGKVSFEIDSQFSTNVLHGSKDPIGGWVSRGYHQKVASTTIVGTGICHGNASFVCRVVIAEPF